MNSTVIILLATYNRAHLIEETLSSIQNQTYAYFECFITDDRSTDNTKDVVQAFCQKDSRFKYFLKPETYPPGLSATRNFGLDLAEKSNVEFIQFFDDDDIMHPQKLKNQIEVFFKDASIDVVNCKYQGFSGSFELKNHTFHGQMNIASENPEKDFLLGNITINSCGPIFKVKLLKDIRFDLELKYTAEEREFYLRLFFLKRPNYKVINEDLFFYRHHQISITANTRNQLEKKGTFIRLDEKLWDFLIDNNLIPISVLSYFIKRFLLDNYNREYLAKIKVYIRNESTLHYLSKKKLLAIMNLHKFYRKLIYKILQ
ncbi:glycosyltransferase family 2 protein [Leeuwenhoekiella sp. A2]|uniref:glycosyltransferase family 2 protein n=1 Tax=Leeuwenhoekiella sp. A2 TaxID=3141460 RepID=UPI003A7FFA48